MNAPSISGFLQFTGANYRLFDLSIQLKSIPNTALTSLDHGQRYLYPHLGFAWLAIFIWDEANTEQNNLWFLKLPLDEQGALVPAVHGDLVRRLYQAMQTTDASEKRRLLTDHPYQFQPDLNKMAALHARASHLLDLPASPHFVPATEFYFMANTTVDWPSLGLQGIADLVARCLNSHEEEIKAALLSVVDKAFIALASQLQHSQISKTLTKTLLTESLRRNNLEVIHAALRGCSQSEDPIAVKEHILQTGAETLDLESMLIVFTYYPGLFTDTDFAVTMLTQLTLNTDEAGFSRIMTNLAMQKNRQSIVMDVFSSPKLTAPLANALSQLIYKARKPNASD